MAAGPELSCWACRAQPVEPGLLQFAAAGSRLPRLPGPPVLEPQLSLTVCLVGLQMDTLSDSIFGSMCASVVVAFSTDSAYVGQPGTANKIQIAAPGTEEKKSRFAPLVAGLAGECFLACCSQLPYLPAWTAALRAAG